MVQPAAPRKVKAEASPPVSPSAPAPAVPDAQGHDLEAQKREAIEKVRVLRNLLEACPSDLQVQTWLTESEQKLSLIKSQIAGRKSPSARLQACLSKKSVADRDALSATADLQAALEEVRMKQAHLTSALALQQELEVELQALKLEGLPAAQAPSPASIVPLLVEVLQKACPDRPCSAEGLHALLLQALSSKGSQGPGAPTGATGNSTMEDDADDADDWGPPAGGTITPPAKCPPTQVDSSQESGWQEVGKKRPGKATAPTDRSRSPPRNAATLLQEAATLMANLPAPSNLATPSVVPARSVATRAPTPPRLPK